MNLIGKALLIFALAAPAAGVPATSAAAAAQRHYDCSKPGNANKAACKTAASPSVAAAKPARTTTTTTATTTTTRHYDCTKAGNANKAACRSAASQTAAGTSAGAVKTTTKTSSTTTDCTKWYNKVRATCRTTTSSAPSHTTIAPAPRPGPATAGRTSAAAHQGAANDNNSPAGATAQCKDGTYSHSAHHSGTCSH